MKAAQKVFALSIGLLLAYMMQSCTASDTSVQAEHKGPMTISIGGASLSDILSSYDTTGVIGVVIVRTITRSSLDSSGGSLVSYDGTVNYGDAYFFDGTGAPADIAELTFNADEFAHVGTGSYSFPLNNLDVYNSSAYNKLRIGLRPDTITTAVFDSIQFGAVPSITNITRGQTLSRRDSITLTWSGTGSNEYARIGFLVRYPYSDSLGQAYWAGGFVPNSGSRTFKFAPAELHLGLTDVSVCRYQVFPISIPSGKKVFLIYAAENSISANVVY